MCSHIVCLITKWFNYDEYLCKFFHSRSKPGTSDKSRGSSLMVSPKKGTSILDTQGHGVSIADEDAVMSHMDSFCTRIKQLIDVINTLSQYNK